MSNSDEEHWKVFEERVVSLLEKWRKCEAAPIRLKIRRFLSEVNGDFTQSLLVKIHDENEAEKRKADKE